MYKTFYAIFNAAVSGYKTLRSHEVITLAYEWWALIMCEVQVLFLKSFIFVIKWLCKNDQLIYVIR